MVERLRLRTEAFQWSALPQYKAHQWDGDPDPFVQAADAIARGQWVAMESGKGTGKTYFGAALLLWFLETFENSVVVTTAPKADQLRLHIWRYVQQLYPSFGRGELQTLRLRMKPPLETWHAVGFVAGVSKSESEASATRAHGFHDPNMLIILEETPGINPAVVSAFEETCSAPNNVIIAFGNPDSQQDALHRFASQPHVLSLRVSSLDHPNVVCRDPGIIPGAQTEQGIDKLLSKYGGNKAHRMYLSRVRGLSPTEPSDALIRWDWCREAAERVPREGTPAMGVDVANSVDGDEGAIAYGLGAHLLEVVSEPCPNANILGETVHTAAKIRGVAPEAIGVDGVGVGAGAVNELRRLKTNVQDIQSAAKPIDIYTEHGHKMQEQFKNLRSQMWWLMRLDLQFGDASGIVLPEDDELWADLCTPKFSTRNGMIHVEPKEDIKKRLGRSPNKGDAAVYWNWVRKRRGTIAATTEDVKPKPERTNVHAVQTAFGVGRHRTW